MQHTFSFHQPIDRRRPKRPERLFFALMPDEEAAGHVSRIRQIFLEENHLRETLLAMERLHLSLHHVGDYTRLRDKVVYAAEQAAKSVVMPAFEVTLHAIQSFPVAAKRRRPLVLLAHGEALPDFHDSMAVAMRRQGFKAGSGFTPHVTIAYGTKPVLPRKIEPIRFTAKDFVLIHSERGLSRYNTLGRWPLRPSG